ncbi:putative translation Initiation factor eIF-4e [Plasmopara halstedii]
MYRTTISVVYTQYYAERIRRLFCTMGTGKNNGDGNPPEKETIETPLQNMYSFWYIKRSTGNKAVSESYEKSIKGIGDFKTVQDFWQLYNHLVRPNDLPNTMDYHLFKTGIKPMWEDPANRRGGKWMVRLRKGIASRYWEDLVLAIIGEQFDVGNEICGAVISVRYNEDIISLWNRNADNNEACYRIRDTMRKVLNLPQFVALEYKRHDMSLNDNSSFRNTTLWRPDKNDSNSRESTANGDRASSSARYSRGDKSTGHQRSGWSRDSKRSFNKSDSNDSGERRSSKTSDAKGEGDQ